MSLRIYFDDVSFSFVSFFFFPSFFLFSFCIFFQFFFFSFFLNDDENVKKEYTFSRTRWQEDYLFSFLFFFMMSSRNIVQKRRGRAYLLSLLYYKQLVVLVILAPCLYCSQVNNRLSQVDRNEKPVVLTFFLMKRDRDVLFSLTFVSFSFHSMIMEKKRKKKKEKIVLLENNVNEDGGIRAKSNRVKI